MRMYRILLLMGLMASCDPGHSLVVENKSGRVQNIKVRAYRLGKDSISIFCDTGHIDFGNLIKKILLQTDSVSKIYSFVLEDKEDAFISNGYDGLYGVSGLIIEGDTIHSWKDSRMTTRRHLLLGTEQTVILK